MYRNKCGRPPPSADAADALNGSCSTATTHEVIDHDWLAGTMSYLADFWLLDNTEACASRSNQIMFLSHTRSGRASLHLQLLAVG